MLNSYIGQDRTKKGSRLNSGHILNKIKFSYGSSLLDDVPILFILFHFLMIEMNK